MSQKSNKTAELLLHRAQQCIKRGELHESLLKLNKSLCHAEASSSTLAHIYASRAGVFYQLRLYDKCLNNISLARECRAVRETSATDLDELEEKCEENFAARVESENQWDFFKLSHQPNARIPFIVDCLEVRHDRKYGRFITTTRDLETGEILALEEPFFRFLKVDLEDREYPETNSFNYCVNCLMDNYLDLLPCLDCNLTMFCSEECREAAHTAFHKYECGILTVLPETGNFQMAIRNFFVSLSVCDGSISELKELMRVSDEQNPTVFNFDLSKGDNRRNYLACMISLTHETKIKMKDFGYIFQHHAHLRRLWESEKEFINAYIERMMQIEILNFHGIKGRSLDAKDPYRRCVGDGSFAFCSLLNHSCCPNVMRIVVDGKMVVIVERPIRAGEQLFDCYIGDSFYFKGKSFRREELEDYNFLCECRACENEFPDIVSGLLTIEDIQMHQMVQRWYRELQDPRKELTIANAKQLATKYSAVLNQHYREESYPCKEIVMLQLCIVKCFLTAARSNIVFP